MNAASWSCAYCQFHSECYGAGQGCSRAHDGCTSGWPSSRLCGMCHIEEALQHNFGTCHCSVNDQAEEGLLKAVENYDNLSLPIMDLVTKALKHDDYVSRLRFILEPPETVQF
ncbi:hypothetical protein HanPI659440_Chr16g0630621 [Helianthus annuus]|nr:hypothetical protein HanPI659440_Chr16g0630621 [Helianthus annuus]